MAIQGWILVGHFVKRELCWHKVHFLFLDNFISPVIIPQKRSRNVRINTAPGLRHETGRTSRNSPKSSNGKPWLMSSEEGLRCDEVHDYFYINN